MNIRTGLAEDWERTELWHKEDLSIQVFHSLRVKAVLKPCGSSPDASVAFTRGKKFKEMVGWVGCILCNAPGFMRAASMVNRLYGWQLAPNVSGCALHNGF